MNLKLENNIVLCVNCFPLGGCHLVLGKTGSGKSALVSNWLQNVKKKKSHDLIYHFAGCSRDSTRRYIHVLLKAAVYGKCKQLDYLHLQVYKQIRKSELFPFLKLIVRTIMVCYCKKAEYLTSLNNFKKM